MSIITELNRTENLQIRFKEVGRTYAAAVNAARRGDTALGLELGIHDTQPKTFAKALLKLAKALPADIPDQREQEGMRFIPLLSWCYHRGFHRPRTLELDWCPIESVEDETAGADDERRIDREALQGTGGKND